MLVKKVACKKLLVKKELVLFSTFLIDFINKIEYIDINKPLEKQTLEKFKNNELFNEIKNKLENEYLMEI